MVILRPKIRDLISALQREIEVLRAENATLRQEVGSFGVSWTKTVRTVASLLERWLEEAAADRGSTRGKSASRAAGKRDMPEAR